MSHFTRRETLKVLGALSTSSIVAGGAAYTLPSVESPSVPLSSEVRRQIFERVWQTPLIDSHEHLPDEDDCLRGPGKTPQEEWTVILGHYLDSDLRAAGMTGEQYEAFFQKPGSPQEKWQILAPLWPRVKNTGYGQAVRIALREIYGIDDLSEKTVDKVQEQYQATRRPGFYKRILCELGKIDSCQVNAGTFHQSKQPLLLLQDISIVGMFVGPNLRVFGEPTGIEVKTLTDWYRVIDWWFDRYAKYAVAVKSQNAYSRNIDYENVTQERAEPLFAKRLKGEALNAEEQKALEDHLFWYAVKKATENHLPVKLHTGYYAGDNRMPLSRLLHNAGAACDLCRMSPHTTFVFMHICYPYYEELIAVAKQYTNAYVDMCWSWIINPVAAKDFLKKYLVTAPANKIFTFGGDYRPVEPVLGHALIARQGIALALSELVEEGWVSLDDALDLVDPIMHENARRVFQVEEKKRNLRSAPWFREE
ncbi:MAG: amidohydrolase family protein [Thermogutta sp.]